MKAKTAAERKQEERDRRREAGLKEFRKWIHPDDEAAAARFFERLNRRRSVAMREPS